MNGIERMLIHNTGEIRLLRFPAASLRNSIFIRMVIIYLIFVIPIILLGIYLYSWSYHNASQEISRTAEAQLTSYLMIWNVKLPGWSYRCSTLWRIAKFIVRR